MRVGQRCPAYAGTGSKIPAEWSMDVKLVVVGGEAPATEYSLTLPSIVGRSRSADVKLGHPLVSRKHCELYESEGQLAVRDLGSLNGTFVGEERIGEAVYLSPGATVTIGAVTFKAVYGDMEAQPADVGADGMPDFLASDDEPRASAVEQTIEMSGDSPITEPAEAASDQEGGFDFGWLEDPADEQENAEIQAVEPEAAIEVESEPEAAFEIESAEVEPEPDIEAFAEASEPASEPEAELELPEPGAESQNGTADDANEFAPPEEQPAASGGDEDEGDLDDFFASLK
jgi:hypothetical protein